VGLHLIDTNLSCIQIYRRICGSTNGETVDTGSGGTKVSILEEYGINLTRLALEVPY
jgi:hypothetical protein